MDLIEAVTVTYELVGQSVSDAALKSLVRDLSAYPVEHVLEALDRCRRELRRGQLTLSEILDRLPGQHPKAEEAWAVVSRCLKNESISVVWTDEMREAYGVASALAGDAVAARMAFKEAYQELVLKARAARKAPCWYVSLGYDPQGREVALCEAVKKNQLSQAYAASLLPSADPIESSVLALVESIAK